MPEIVLSIEIDAPAAAVWDAVTDWGRQGEWMLGTTVRPTRGAGAGVGERIVARTAFGPFGFDDEMQIVRWDAPARCDVVHLGKVVRGSASFEVAPLGEDRSRFTWAEWLDLPLGVLGEVGFAVVRPLALVGIRYSLRRLARWVPAR